MCRIYFAPNHIIFPNVSAEVKCQQARGQTAETLIIICSSLMEIFCIELAGARLRTYIAPMANAAELIWGLKIWNFNIVGFNEYLIIRHDENWILFAAISLARSLTHPLAGSGECANALSRCVCRIMLTAFCSLLDGWEAGSGRARSRWMGWSMIEYLRAHGTAHKYI